MDKNLKTIILTIICISLIQALIYFNYKNYYKEQVSNSVPVQENTQIQNNQFPFSMIEYNIQLGSTQLPDEITLDKINLFNIKCYIKKENTNFAINYKIQYLGLKNCGLSLIPITNANNSINAYNFVEFEPLQIIEFNTTASSIDQLKTIKPFVTFLKDNASKIRTFSFMSLDDVAIPY